MNESEKIWDLDIYEIKLGGVNGVSFRIGQTFVLKNVKRIYTSIIRDLNLHGQEIFMVFSAPVDEERNESLTKLSKGEPVYIVFDI